MLLQLVDFFVKENCVCTICKTIFLNQSVSRSVNPISNISNRAEGALRWWGVRTLSQKSWNGRKTQIPGKLVNFSANVGCSWSNLSRARPKVMSRIGFGAGAASFSDPEALEINCARSRISVWSPFLVRYYNIKLDIQTLPSAPQCPAGLLLVVSFRN